MEINTDCFQCILNQIIPMARNASEDETVRRAMIRRMLRVISESDSRTTPPDIAAAFHREFRLVSGRNDLYRAQKDQSTRLALQLLPELRKMVETAADPFLAALKLAIGGNIIDYGCDPDFDLETAERRIREACELPFDEAAGRRLRQRIDGARSIFYILDNCGEAVVDRLLLEYCSGKVTLGVRGQPILNDVTRREAAMSGLDGMPIVDTGDVTPGVSAIGTGEEFLRAMQTADLIIAKGQGNYESLDRSDLPIVFLLRVKCGVIARRLANPLHSLQVLFHNL